MSGFNFGQIADTISQFFDTDYVDIKRDINGQLQEIYSNIPCHIAFASTDNPNPETVDIKPIIQSLNIHFPLWVDVQNNDFITAKRMSNDNDLLAVYSGRCGNPIVSQGRKKVSMTMSATESEEPTPVPPKNPIKITIQYLENDVEIQDSSIVEVEETTNFYQKAPKIDGYIAVNCEINGELQDSDIAIINDVESEITIKFIYESSNVSTGFRFLVKGLYTKNDGSLANGYHLYKEIDIDSISENDSEYTISSDDVKLEHEDNGKNLEIKVGAKLLLIPNDIFIQVESIGSRGNGKVTFIARQFTPTEDELNAYVTRWYD